MRLLAFVGPSGVGKTTLLERLIPLLVERGVSVAVLKHSHHEEFDRPGADTRRMREAGARAVAIAGPAGIAYFGPGPASPRALARLLPDVDVVICEGFKTQPLPKIEVHRRAVGRGFLCVEDRSIVAVVTDEPPPRDVPAFGFDELDALAGFVLRRVGRGRGLRRNRTATRARRRPGAST